MQNRNGSILVVILSLLLVASLSVTGYFIWQNQQVKLISSTEKTIYIKPTPFIDETENWQLYKNNDFNFQIKYPNDMFFQKSSTLDIKPYIFIGSFIENKYADQKIHNPFIGINIIETDLNQQEWFDKKATKYSFIGMGNAPKTVNPRDFEYSGVSNVGPYGAINNFEALRFDSEGTSYELRHTIWKFKEGYLVDVYKHTSGAGEVSDKIYNQILDSFKIL